MKVSSCNGSALQLVLLCALLGHGLSSRIWSRSMVGDRLATSAAAQILADDPNFHLGKAIDAASRNIDYSKAAATLKQRSDVPADVAAMLDLNSSNSLDEASLAKARNFLNAIVESNMRELDAQLVAAKEFELHSVRMKDQTVADISRLSADVADDGGNIAKGNACSSDIQKEMDVAKDEQHEALSAYTEEYNRMSADLVVKQNDLDVFTFLTGAVETMCNEQASASPTSLLQVARGGIESIHVCSGSTGSTLRFSNMEAQVKFNNLLAKSTNSVLRNALAMVSDHVRPMSFLEVKQKPVPVAEGADKDMADLKCGPITDCGPLSEEIASEWGKYQDQVEALKAEMTDREAEWTSLKESNEAQLVSMVAASTECTRLLGEATGAKNTDEQLLAEKEEQSRKLHKEHDETMTTFRNDIQTIFNHMCSFITVRNEVMKKSEVCSPEKIDDCVVSSWTPDTCTVACDDTCPQELALQTNCGGQQRLTRQRIQSPNDCGYACPVLTANRKCNQVKCPVDCVMSSWSGWTKCSKDCGGGIEQATRSIITKPKHDGEGCKAVAKARTCNLGSCDRDCVLSEWSSWSPCSVACGGGIQKRTKTVLMEQRNNGICEKATSSGRSGEQICNVQECVGDEICIAEQDLLIAVDGSGSVPVGQDGWDLVVNFTGELLKRYQTEYSGLNTMKIGLIEFGNGAVDEDGSVAKAELLMPLSNDMPALKQAASGMTHFQFGFTNMAQAFVLAETELGRNGRLSAQSAVMVISDGQPTEKLAAEEKGKELTDKGIMKFIVAIAQSPDSEVFLQELASQPWETNLVSVPEFDSLMDGAGPFVKKAITRFCPNSISPSTILATAQQTGWRLVYEEGYCGGLGKTLSRNTFDPQKCYELASEYGATGYSMGRKYRKGKCCVETLKFTCETYKQWEQNPAHPTCEGSWSKGFHKSKYYDWYAIQPGDCF